MMNFTKQELNDIKILIRLGDSENLAKQTVIDNRGRNNQECRDSYEYAYYS